MMALARTAREWPRIWREEGREEGQVELLKALAAQRFGNATATILAERLEHLGDGGAFVDVGRWIWECDDAAELLARVDRLSPGPG